VPEAIRCFNRAIELDPGAPVTYANLAMLYRAVGDGAGAARVEQSAREATERPPQGAPR
jgi:Flp pilus assembly protein TadD